MNQTRTGGMTAIGILNIVFGCIGCLFALVTVLGGGLLTALGTAAGESGAETGAEFAAGGGEVAAAGGAIMLFGLFGLAVGVILFVAGIGVMKVAPWGRSLSLAAAALAIVSNIGKAVILSAFGIGTVFGLIYPAVLIFCFMQPGWRAAFSRERGGDTAGSIDADNDQFQAAA
jgi:hypothetical protein